MRYLRCFLAFTVFTGFAALARQTPEPPAPPPPSSEEERRESGPARPAEADDATADPDRPADEREVLIDPAPPPAPPTADPVVEPEGADDPGVAARAAAARRDSGFPDANIYLPEGELDIKVRKLIKNSLFEGQVNYNFVDGDVSTFLRYKYYSRNFSYKLGVFDELEFDQLGGSTEEFDRTRGGLFLIGYPKSYDQRYTLLTQVDSLAFGDLTRPDNDTTNVYAKLGYQFGTESDERLNSIVGEARGRIIPVLTAYRDIGPRQMGWAAALTWSSEAAGSDFDYLKAEAEMLKRLDLGNDAVLVNRIHLGTFLQRTRLSDLEEVPDRDEFLIPRYELFKLGGRDLLKGVDGDVRGTDEIHATSEYLYPIFRDRDLRSMGANFRDFYSILYAGVGTAAFETGELAEPDNWVLDAGVGFETSFRVRNYDVILTALYAMPVVSPSGMDDGGEFRVAARAVR